MANKQLRRIKTITEFHRVRGLPKPQHPLISLIDFASIRHSTDNNSISWVYDFYSISLKRDLNAKVIYGQQESDFDEGIMFFIAPGQVFRIEIGEGPIEQHSGWILLVHPDFLWNTPLAQKITQYEFFDYSVNEALFLSDKEETTIDGILQNMLQEYHSNIHKFSQDVVVAQLELLLTYADRYYHRQFITRKINNHQILGRLEDILTKYFNSDDLARKGLPTVQYIAESLNVSPGYLSSLLKVLTGQSTQQHIHDKLIEKAKGKLATTDLSVSEIAYVLGFEHPQSFSRLFKIKTRLSPLEFRESFN
jgi:AraC family transcriptional regulator, transcriptional activator of pobA